MIKRLLITALGMVAVLAVPAATQAVSTNSVVITLEFDDGWANQWAAKPILASNHVHATFFIVTIRPGTHRNGMSWGQIRRLAAAGNEIAGHTITHPWLTQISAAQGKKEICGGRAQLVAHGFQPTDFAFPYGASSSTLEKDAANCGFVSARNIGGVWVSPTVCGECPYAQPLPPEQDVWGSGGLYLLRTPPPVMRTTTLTALEGYVTRAQQHGGGWLQFVMHQVCNGCDPLSISPTTLSAFIDWLQAQQIEIKTSAEVLAGYR